MRTGAPSMERAPRKDIHHRGGGARGVSEEFCHHHSTEQMILLQGYPPELASREDADSPKCSRGNGLPPSALRAPRLGTAGLVRLLWPLIGRQKLVPVLRLHTQIAPT